MEPPSTLTADLRTLTEALDPPREDLETLLRELIAQLRLTSASYLGLTVSIVSAGTMFTISTFADDETPPVARSSVLLPLTTLCAVEHGSTLVLYAAGEFAFVNFAAEVTIALDLRPGEVSLDADLVPPIRTQGLSEIAERRHTNQALGILIERGFTPEAATIELARLAAVDAITPGAAAVLLVGIIGGRKA